MRKKSKALLLVLCAVMLVVGSVMGTVAYLTSSTETVSNTFTIGQVNITLTETKVDEYGVKLTGSEAGTTDAGQEYKMLPGREYVKDPIVTVVSGSEQCWLFVRVENGILSYESDEATIASQLAANGWTLVEGETDVYYHAIVDARDAEQTVKVFEKFIIADDADNVTGWSEVTPQNTKVSVTAYAIQADGFNDADKTEAVNAAAAWAALGA